MDSKISDAEFELDESTGHWPDGVKFFSKRWIPLSSQPPRALLIALHGFAEHVGRYDHVWPLFSRRNIEVFAYDQRGAGRSGPIHGDTTLNQNLTDLEYIIGQECQQLCNRGLQDVPLFLYGHSMVWLQMVCKRSVADGEVFRAAA